MKPMATKSRAVTVLITEVQAESPLVKECNSLDQMIDVNLSTRGTLVGHPSNPLKRIKRKHKHPIAFGVLRTSKGKKKRDVLILFDSSATGSYMSEEHAHKLRVKNTSATVWKMGNGNIQTDKKVKTHFKLPELYPERIIEHTFHLLPTT